MLVQKVVTLIVSCLTEQTLAATLGVCVSGTKTSIPRAVSQEAIHAAAGGH